MLKLYTHQVQMVNDAHDIIHNSCVKKLYPTLFKEVSEQTKASHNSWYDLSDEVYFEYEHYVKANT